MTIGKRISDLRKTFSYSQEYVAEKIGVSRQAVSKWEQDQTAPDTYNLIALAELFHVTVEYLATGRKEEEQKTDKKVKSNYTAQIIGVVLLSIGLFVLLTPISKVVSIYLFVFAILCLVVRKHLGIVLMWAFTIMLLFNIISTSSREIFHLISFGLYREMSMGSLVAMVLVVMLIASTVCTILAMKSQKKKQRK